MSPWQHQHGDIFNNSNSVTNKQLMLIHTLFSHSLSISPLLRFTESSSAHGCVRYTVNRLLAHPNAAFYYFWSPWSLILCYCNWICEGLCDFVAVTSSYHWKLSIHSQWLSLSRTVATICSKGQSLIYSKSGKLQVLHLYMMLNQED